MTDPLRSLQKLKYQPQPERWEALATRAPRRRWVMAGVALAAALLLGAFLMRPSGAHFDAVVREAGAERVTALREDRWFETSASESARVTVANIGNVRVEPSSKLRLLHTGPTEHRLQLAHGTLHAVVDAPPRLFVVETPATTAVDLGCAYTLSVEGEETHLTVESGEVALEGQRRVSTVPRGMHATARPGQAPSTPVALDAGPEFVAAVKRFDETGEVLTLDAIALHARSEDSATLWHLLPRADDAHRVGLGEKLASFVARPATWAAGDDARLDSKGMQAWWRALRAQ